MINKKIETRGAKPQIVVGINGEFKTLKQLSAEYNLPYITLSKRYHKGLRGYDLIKPIADKLSMARKFRVYEKQLMRNRSN
jgi:hypothetical protein